MKREKWKPSKWSTLCSGHFTDSCYDISPWATRKNLKQDAVPSIFNFPEHLRKTTKHRPSPKKRTSNEAHLNIESIAE